MVRKLYDNVTGEPYFLEVRTNRQFRRTACGLAWPWGDLVAGCVLVLGELRAPPNALGARRHLHVLAEERSFSTDEMLDHAERLQALWLFPRVITPSSDKRIILLDAFNDARRRERKPILRSSDPAMWQGKGDGMLPYYVSLLQARITDDKSLFFGADCSARDEAKRMNEKDLSRKMVEEPGVCALSWALEEIDANPMPEWGARHRGHYGPADAVGGY